MQAKTVEALEQKLAKAKARERALAEQIVNANRRAARRKRADDRAARRRRGEILDEHWEAMFPKDDVVQAFVMRWMDERLVEPRDRAAFGLAATKAATPL